MPGAADPPIPILPRLVGLSLSQSESTKMIRASTEAAKNKTEALGLKVAPSFLRGELTSRGLFSFPFLPC